MKIGEAVGLGQKLSQGFKRIVLIRLTHQSDELVD
jgi:hypothetical protein